ncbi:MAG: restriction endonuclease subunit S [Ruminococcus sp.]|nr:restriction endonuclease subunit S [Ruminococcus sp.]
MENIFDMIERLCPDGVEYIRLNTICDIYDGTHQTPNYTESGVKFISVENIGNIYATEKYISEEDNNKYKIKPQINDVFMTRIGNVGTCAVVEKNIPIAYYVSLALLRPNTEVLNSKYLKYYIESKYGRKELYKITLINAIPMKINMGDIGKIMIKLPPLEVQCKIADILDGFTELTELLKRETELRQKQYEYYRDIIFDFKRR